MRFAPWSRHRASAVETNRANAAINDELEQLPMAWAMIAICDEARQTRRSTDAIFRRLGVPVARLRCLQQTAQDILQDAAMPEVFEFVERIDAADDWLLAHPAARIVNPQRQVHARF